MKGFEMLVLSRRVNESIMIGNNVEITIVDISGGKVRLGIKAPKDIEVHRREIFDAIEKEKKSDIVDVKARRTACIGNRQKEVMLEIEKFLSKVDGNMWIKIIKGGVTGSESLEMSEKNIKSTIRYGWTACIGTEDKWDILFIPAVEMKKLWKALL